MRSRLAGWTGAQHSTRCVRSPGGRAQARAAHASMQNRHARTRMDGQPWTRGTLVRKTVRGGRRFASSPLRTCQVQNWLLLLLRNLLLRGLLLRSLLLGSHSKSPPRMTTGEVASATDYRCWRRRCSRLRRCPYLCARNVPIGLNWTAGSAQSGESKGQWAKNNFAAPSPWM